MGGQQGEKSKVFQATEKLPPANIMVAGKTGAGKSTLLNAVFGSSLAKTGTGRPVTSEIKEYQGEDLPICIWDTVGLELDSEKTKQSIDSIKKTIASKVSNKDKFDRMHAIWYCINANTNRYEGAELEFIKELYDVGVPFIIVLTQCYGSSKNISEFEKIINNINASKGMDKIRVVRVLALDYKFEIGDEEYVKKPFGLDNLVNVTLQELPNYIETSFIAAQRVSQIEKRAECIKTIYECAIEAEKGFFDKVPLIMIFKTDGRIKNLFKKLGTIYNIVIPEDEIEQLLDNIGGLHIMDAVWLGLWPFRGDFDKEVQEALIKKGDKPDYRFLETN